MGAMDMMLPGGKPLDLTDDAAKAIAALLRERWPGMDSAQDAGGNASAILDRLALPSPEEGQPAGLILALGLGDQLPADQADALVANLCLLADRVLFAAIAPGSSEVTEPNPQWPSYWIEKFAAHGLHPDDGPRTALWTLPGSPIWLRQGLLVFERSVAAPTRPATAFDVAHPEQMGEAMKRLYGLTLDNQRLLAYWSDPNKTFAPPDVHWCRIVMNRETKRLMESIDYKSCSALEISGNAWQGFGFKDFTIAIYPDFDVTKQIARKPDGSGFDVVIAEQVMEHVPTPWVAVTSMRSSLNPGGHLLITAPFFIRVHGHPGDYTRWTESGLRNLLEYAGFAPDAIQTGSWGNRACVTANFVGSVYRAEAYDPTVHSLENEPDVPIMVWAFARN
jgi:hypothetical protein